ncbi:SEL1-like repeat protein [Acidovorax sp. Q11]
MHATAYGSSGGMYIPTPCEREWGRSAFVQPMPPEQIRAQESWAKNGDADAQYFMGLAAQDKDDRLAWLKKAIANGSKGAAAYYAYVLDPRWKTEPVDPAEPDGERKPISPPLLKELLQPVIDAAEAGEPQAATWLMEMGRARWNYRSYPDHPILKITDIPKWAEIAARGGNPAAAEWLCTAHDKNLSEVPGVEKKDDAQAFYWCSMAAPRACSVGAKLSLSKLYDKGRGVAPSKTMAEYWIARFRKSLRSIQIEGLFPPQLNSSK